jgi:A/G-specific adenine glycosylase
MDYGAELKKVTVNPNRNSAHYARQSRFKGSLREIRGAIVKKLAGEGKQDGKTLLGLLENDLEGLQKDDFYRAVETLKKDMMVAEEEGVYRIQ